MKLESRAKNSLTKISLAMLSSSLLVAALSSCASNKPDANAPATESVSAERPAALPPQPSTPVTVFEMKFISADKQVRVVKKPTLAALDFAAYFNNPIRLAGKEEKPENYTGKMASTKLAEYPFPMLDSLSEYEPAAIAGRHPLAWEPLAKILYAQTGNDSLAQILNSVEAVKWNEPDVFRAFQTVTRMWGVPLSDGSVDWWVEVMPAPWTGRSVFYGKLKLSSTGETAEILNYYLTGEMNIDDAMNWARTLSSYW